MHRAIAFSASSDPNACPTCTFGTLSISEHAQALYLACHVRIVSVVATSIQVCAAHRGHLVLRSSSNVSSVTASSALHSASNSGLGLGTDRISDSTLLERLTHSSMNAFSSAAPTHTVTAAHSISISSRPILARVIGPPSRAASLCLQRVACAWHTRVVSIEMSPRAASKHLLDSSGALARNASPACAAIARIERSHSSELWLEVHARVALPIGNHCSVFPDTEHSSIVRAIVVVVAFVVMNSPNHSRLRPACSDIDALYWDEPLGVERSASSIADSLVPEHHSDLGFPQPEDLPEWVEDRMRSLDPVDDLERSLLT